VIRALLILQEQFSSLEFAVSKEEFWLNQEIFDDKLFELQVQCPISKLLNNGPQEIQVPVNEDGQITNEFLDELITIQITNIYRSCYKSNLTFESIEGGAP